VRTWRIHTSAPPDEVIQDWSEEHAALLQKSDVVILFREHDGKFFTATVDSVVDRPRVRFV
jgi:hypothetical protein